MLLNMLSTDHFLFSAVAAIVNEHVQSVNNVEHAICSPAAALCFTLPGMTSGAAPPWIVVWVAPAGGGGAAFSARDAKVYCCRSGWMERGLPRRINMSEGEGEEEGEEEGTYGKEGRGGGGVSTRRLL